MDRHLIGFAARLSEPLSLLSVGVSIGAFPNERSHGTRRSKKLVREASVTSRNALVRVVYDTQELQRAMIDLESMVNKAMGRRVGLAHAPQSAGRMTAAPSRSVRESAPQPQLPIM